MPYISSQVSSKEMLFSAETLCIARTTSIGDEFKDLSGLLINRTWKERGKPTQSQESFITNTWKASGNF